MTEMGVGQLRSTSKVYKFSNPSYLYNLNKQYIDAKIVYKIIIDKYKF